MSRGSAFLRRAALPLALGLFGAYCAAVIFLRPSEMAVFVDGHGYQLAGGAEILAGRHPFIDFDDNYGPLVFYASALAQAVSGGGLRGEFILTCAAMGATFALLFVVMRGLQIPTWLAAAATALAALAVSAPYRYYLVLGPMAFLALAWRYTAAPRPLNLALLALGVTVTGLFRPDFGMFTFLTGCVLLVADGGIALRVRLGRLLAFAGLVLAWAIPWLAWIAAHDQLLNYLSLSSVEALHKAAHFNENIAPAEAAQRSFVARAVLTYFLRVPWLIVGLGAVLFAVRWRALSPLVRRRLITVLALAILSLIQISHRLDWMHVRDVLPLGFILLAWIITDLDATPQASPAARALRISRRTLAAAIGLTIAIGAVTKESRHGFTPATVARTFGACGASFDDMLARMHRDPDPYEVVRLIDFVRERTPPETPLFVTPEGPQLNYFCQRPLLGRRLAIMRGYFDSPPRIAEFTGRLEAQPPALVILNGPPANKNFVPEIARYIEAHYHRDRMFHRTYVLTPRNATTAPK